MPGAAEPLVHFERRGTTAWITLDRAEKRNALTPRLVADLAGALDSAETEAGIAVAVITATTS